MEGISDSIKFSTGHLYPEDQTLTLPHAIFVQTYTPLTVVSFCIQASPVILIVCLVLVVMGNKKRTE